MLPRQTPDRRDQPNHTLQHVLKTRAVSDDPADRKYLQDAITPYLLDYIWDKNHESALGCIGASEFVLEWTKVKEIMQIAIYLDPAVAMPAILRFKTAIKAKLAARWPQALPLQMDNAKEAANQTAHWIVRTADATSVTIEQFDAWAVDVTQEVLAENNYVSLDRKRRFNLYRPRGPLLAQNTYRDIRYRICRKMQVKPTNVLLASDDRKYFQALSTR